MASLQLSRPLAITSVTYHPFGLDEALAGIGGAGFTHVELVSIDGHCSHYPIDPDDDNAQSIQAALDRHGLTLSAIGAGTGLATARGIEQAKRAVELAPKLGINIIVNSIAGPAGHDEDLDGFYHHVGAALEHARLHDVIIALELHGNHTGNGRAMLNVISKINHPNLKINYDTANCMLHGGEWPYEDLQAVLPHVVNLHLKDKIGGKGVWNLPPIGLGEIDFERVFNMLDDGGYRGSMSIEIEFDDAGVPPLPQVNEAAALSYRNAMQLIEARA